MAGAASLGRSNYLTIISPRGRIRAETRGVVETRHRTHAELAADRSHRGERLQPLCDITYGAIPKRRVCGFITGSICRASAATPSGSVRNTRSRESAIVLQVSWMIPEKGVEDLIEAANWCLRRIRTCNSSWVAKACAAGIHGARRSGRIADHFTWTGLIDDPLASGVYQAADVFANYRGGRRRSADDRRGHGLRQARGRVAGWRNSGDRRDGISGYLVHRRQPAEAADRILRC